MSFYTQNNGRLPLETLGLDDITRYGLVSPNKSSSTLSGISIINTALNKINRMLHGFGKCVWSDSWDAAIECISACGTWNLVSLPLLTDIGIFRILIAIVLVHWSSCALYSWMWKLLNFSALTSSTVWPSWHSGPSKYCTTIHTAMKCTHG